MIPCRMKSREGAGKPEMRAEYLRYSKLKGRKPMPLPMYTKVHREILQEARDLLLSGKEADFGVIGKFVIRLTRKGLVKRKIVRKSNTEIDVQDLQRKPFLAWHPLPVRNILRYRIEPTRGQESLIVLLWRKFLKDDLYYLNFMSRK